MPARKQASDSVLEELRRFGLEYPCAHLKSPWPGHLDLAVKDKTFAYLSVDGEPFSISCKLPRSNAVALMLPFAEPTGYGLGKSGWVSAKFPSGEKPPIDLLKAWIDESYRAQAPKRLVTSLSSSAPARGAAKNRSRKRSPEAATSASTRTHHRSSSAAGRETNPARPAKSSKTRRAKKRVHSRRP
jgi:hypothetical protein